ncbi:multiprotein-bridging factor 1 family protein [Streptomyces sp. NPDC057654]|uniref:helix-turn-helix domain-containing protein n=1 Tax=Streptomyces sp. NPDC057654 TaxID=3346196 RepID=UPI0036B5A737
MSDSTPTAGQNIAVLRKALGWGQGQLARRMGVSASLLRKVEDGTRTATPPTVAAAAKAMRITTDRIYGTPFSDPSEQRVLLDELRAAVRRHTLPREDVPPLPELATGLREATQLRADTRYLELLRKLPKLLGQATAVALTAGGDAQAWGQLADLYGCAYAVAHRLSQAGLADVIVSRQQWAAMQTWNPDAVAGAAWNEAGTYQSAGEYGDGLVIVDRAIVRYEQTHPADTPEAAISLGSLHLRGVVLASRAKDRNAWEAHNDHAKALAERFPRDVLLHNLTFGPGNQALYELAAHVELARPDRASEMAQPLMDSPPPGLGANRIGRLCIDTARARLDLSDIRGAEEALKRAHEIAPQMAEIHPMAREVLRVLFTLHQRSRPDLMNLARRSGLTPEL